MDLVMIDYADQFGRRRWSKTSGYRLSNFDWQHQKKNLCKYL